jgi:hypothetical protein
LPWAEIESVTKAEFSDVERQEIHGCVIFALITRHHSAAGTKQADIDEFSTKLLKMARKLTAFFDEYLPAGNIDLSEGIKWQGDNWKWKAGVITGFANQHSVECLESGERGVHSPLEPIVDARGAIAAVVELLSKEFEVMSPATQNEPDADSLAWFVSIVGGGATRKPARNFQPGSFGPESFELSRWGIAVGPNTNAFRRLAELALGRKITKHQMESAFKKLKGSDVG